MDVMPSLRSPSQALYFQVDHFESKYLSWCSSLQKCYDRTSFLLKTLYQSSLSQLLSSPKSRLDSLLPLFDVNRSSALILEQQEHLVEGGSKEMTPFPFLPPLLFQSSNLSLAELSLIPFSYLLSQCENLLDSQTQLNTLVSFFLCKPYNLILQAPTPHLIRFSLLF